ncbi:MAG: DNA alkylation repair protein [Prevotellaceae bacterium]|jgi:3-methyladenine DNA glycosylase AlkD|nr:DNA alkylation repair protein [Prevotellaceae bacterium]
MMTRDAQQIVNRLISFQNKEKEAFFPRFFKAGKGEYGEGDRFLGIVVPNVRRVAKENLDASQEIVDQLLQNPYHEVRLCGLLIWVEQFKKTKNAAAREQMVQFYLQHYPRINNWDLVDLSAPYIVGEYLLTQPHDERMQLLSRVADIDYLWAQRIAMVSTLTLVRKGEPFEAIALSERFLRHRHDLMHKAVGWVLREIGKRDLSLLRAFLDRHSRTMPRTMLRYAIERMSDEERRYYMRRE